jgi:preprotein translocase subunit SecF
MKFYTFIFSLLSTLTLFAQSNSGADLERKVENLESRNKQINKRLAALEYENFKLMQKIDSLESRTQNQINRSQELQSQNERAMNLALDGFSTKFEDQNKTVKDVQNQLSEGFVSQLVMFVLAVLVLVVIFVIMSKKSTQKALDSHSASWNQFQEHLLKK